MRWDNDELEFLIKNSKKMTINSIAINIQIPVEKILSKAIELNLVYEVKQLTDPEIFIKNQLEKMNIKFEYQKNIYYNKCKYRVDYIIDNIIIEIQGDYYHCNPRIYKHGPINSIQANNIAKDN